MQFGELWRFQAGPWSRPKAGLGAFLVILAPVKIRKRQLSCHGGWPAGQDHG